MLFSRAALRPCKCRRTRSVINHYLKTFAHLFSLTFLTVFLTSDIFKSHPVQKNERTCLRTHLVQKKISRHVFESTLSVSPIRQGGKLSMSNPSVSVFGHGSSFTLSQHLLDGVGSNQLRWIGRNIVLKCASTVKDTNLLSRRPRLPKS